MTYLVPSDDQFTLIFGAVKVITPEALGVTDMSFFVKSLHYRTKYIGLSVGIFSKKKHTKPPIRIVAMAARVGRNDFCVFLLATPQPGYENDTSLTGRQTVALFSMEKKQKVAEQEFDICFEFSRKVETVEPVQITALEDLPVDENLLDAADLEIVAEIDEDEPIPEPQEMTNIEEPDDSEPEPDDAIDEEDEQDDDDDDDDEWHDDGDVEAAEQNELPSPKYERISVESLEESENFGRDVQLDGSAVPGILIPCDSIDQVDDKNSRLDSSGSEKSFNERDSWNMDLFTQTFTAEETSNALTLNSTTSQGFIKLDLKSIEEICCCEKLFVATSKTRTTVVANSLKQTDSEAKCIVESNKVFEWIRGVAISG